MGARIWREKPDPRARGIAPTEKGYRRLNPNQGFFRNRKDLASFTEAKTQAMGLFETTCWLWLLSDRTATKETMTEAQVARTIIIKNKNFFIG